MAAVVRIQVNWKGPLSCEAAMQAQNSHSYGLYQLYAKHSASPSSTLRAG